MESSRPAWATWRDPVAKTNEITAILSHRIFLSPLLEKAHAFPEQAPWDSGIWSFRTLRPAWVFFGQVWGLRKTGPLAC
jgi:hypothetical protein